MRKFSLNPVPNMLRRIDNLLQDVDSEELRSLTRYVVFNYILNGKAMYIIDLCPNHLIAYFRDQLPDPINKVVFEGDPVNDLVDTSYSVYLVESLVANSKEFHLHTYLKTSQHQSYLHNTLMNMGEYMKYVSVDFCSTCSGLGYLDLLVFAHKNGAVWDMRTTQKAFNNKHFDCFIYAYNNNCPIPDSFYDDVLKIAVFNDEPKYLSTIIEDINMEDDYITIDEGLITAIIEHNALKVGKYMLKRGYIDNRYETLHDKMFASGSYKKMCNLFVEFGVYNPFQGDTNSFPLTRKGNSQHFEMGKRNGY